MKAKEELLNILEEEIREQINMRKTFSWTNSVLQRILDNIDLHDEESEKFMSMDSLRRRILGLLWAGHDTVASTLSMTVVRLCIGSDNMMSDGKVDDEKLFEESRIERYMQELEAEHVRVGIHRDQDIDTVSDLVSKHAKSMRFHDAFVRETLRLRPVAVFVSKEITRPVEIAGRMVEPGTKVGLCIGLRQRDDEIHLGKADAFIPERFLDTDTPVHAAATTQTAAPRQYGSTAQCGKSRSTNTTNAAVDRFRHIPFGAGPHACLGKELALLECRLLLCELVRHRVRLSIDGGEAPTWKRLPSPIPSKPVHIHVSTMSTLTNYDQQ